MALIPSTIEKNKRSQYQKFLDITPSSTATWKVIGIGISEASVEFGPQVETEQWIIEDSARNDHTGNQKQLSVTQKCYKNDPEFEFVNAGRDELNYKSHILEVDTWTKDASDKSHAHANKATLDAISPEVKSGYDALVSVLGTINALDTSALVPSETAIPTSYAVDQYILAFDISNKVLQKVFPVGSVYIGPSSPATFVGGSWTQVNDVGISASYVAWKRTA